MNKREKVYNKFSGKCAYSGTTLKTDWQIDHIVPKRKNGTNHISNLFPAQKIVNHYKRSLSVEDFRVHWLGGLHKRLAKLPKNPRTEKSKKRITYLWEVSNLFGITPEKPFNGIFYFETLERKWEL